MYYLIKITPKAYFCRNNLVKPAVASHELCQLSENNKYTAKNR